MRNDWEASLKQMAENGDEELLIDNVFEENSIEKLSGIIALNPEKNYKENYSL